jgi:predicted dithiol-disulfide oxidoreductase (DUF899 family)
VGGLSAIGRSGGLRGKGTFSEGLALRLPSLSDPVRVASGFGINVFLRDGDQIYRSYHTTARAAEELSSVGAPLDITPFGRQEDWQDAPEGVPQDPTGSWTRRHDEYTPEELAGGRTT